MPRNKKKKQEKEEGNSPEGRRSDALKVLADFWTARIKAGQEKQKEYRLAREEVVNYLKTNHESLYTDPLTQQYIVNVSGAAAVSVPKVAQMVNTLMPRLSYDKPQRTVNPTGEDGIIIALARVLEEYMSYTGRECLLAKQIRKAIVEGLVGGRAFLQLIWDEVRELVTSKFLRSVDVVIDPDFDDIEDAKWIAIRYKQPYWEMERRVPENQRWRIKDLDKKGEAPKDDGKKDETGDMATTDMITYWVVYSKMGRGWRGVEMEDERRSKRRGDGEDFVRLEIVPNHHSPISDGQWDVPSTSTRSGRSPARISWSPWTVSGRCRFPVK